MNDIFAKDLSGEMVSPDEPGYDELITDIFATIMQPRWTRVSYAWGRPIVIEDKVWIGINSTILPGVRIGYGASE